MRFPVLAAIVISVFSLGACAASVSPLYTKSDSITEPGLVGTWVGDKPEDSFSIAQGKGAAYRLATHSAEDGTDAIYDVHLTKVNGASFADVFLDEFKRGDKGIDLPGGAVALHCIVKFQLAGDDLSVWLLDPDAIQKAAKSPGFPLRSSETEESGGTLVIFSPTNDIRGYLAAHPSDLFGDVQHFRRKP